MVDENLLEVGIVCVCGGGGIVCVCGGAVKENRLKGQERVRM